MVRRLLELVLATTGARWPLVVRCVAGVVFVSFSFGKFLHHSAEVAAFERYGIPAPEVATYAVGTLELAGGLLLILGLGTRLVALALAGNMVGAISTAGPVDGGPIHLGLAPALLVAMLLLVWAGAGARSLDLAMGRRMGIDERPAPPAPASWARRGGRTVP